jgi:hypothetical protein
MLQFPAFGQFAIIVRALIPDPPGNSQREDPPLLRGLVGIPLNLPQLGDKEILFGISPGSESTVLAPRTMAIIVLVRVKNLLGKKGLRKGDMVRTFHKLNVLSIGSGQVK